MKVLVIDDDEATRQTISRVLRSGGHEVAGAEDGARGMDLFFSERPEIVVIDIFMPDPAGTELIVKLRRLNPRVKIIAISGGGQISGIDALSMARSLGADEIIGKPFRARDLLGLIDGVMPGDSDDSIVS